MKFNFTQVPLTDIDGKAIEKNEIHKTIANILWMGAKKLDLVEVAMAINKGEEVELEKADVVELQRLVKDPKSGLLAFAQKAILDYVESVRKPKPAPEPAPATEPEKKKEPVSQSPEPESEPIK